VPINWLVGLETLKAGFGWSDEKLYDHFCFDLQVRYALGIHDLNESDFDPSVCLTCPFHLAEHCPAHPGKKRPSFRLRFIPAQMTAPQRRRKMRLSKQTGKNPRAAIEGTIREVKHPFPAGKLPVRGLFRMTCLMVGTAAMTNARRIHH
jgi:hypothetical protein